MDERPARSMPHSLRCSCGDVAVVTVHGVPLCGHHALKVVKAEKQEKARV